MSNNQDDFAEQTETEQVDSFQVGNPVASPTNYGSFQPHPGGFQGTPVQQGQAPMEVMSGRFSYPSMQHFSMDPGTGRLPIPSGYPANALPGNIGRMRYPAVNPVGQVCPPPVNGASVGPTSGGPIYPPPFNNGGAMCQVPVNSATSDMCPPPPPLSSGNGGVMCSAPSQQLLASAPIETSDPSDNNNSHTSSDSQFYPPVLQFPHNNNSDNDNNSEQQQQESFSVFPNNCGDFSSQQQMPMYQQPHPISNGNGCEGNMPYQQFHQNGSQQFVNNSPMYQDNCQPMYPDFTFQPPQQNMGIPSMRPQMGGMAPRFMGHVRQPLPPMNTNVFPGSSYPSYNNLKAPNPQSDDWQQSEQQHFQHQPLQLPPGGMFPPTQVPNPSELMASRMQTPQKVNNFEPVMQPNMFSTQVPRQAYPQMCDQSWRQQSPNTLSNVQNSLPNVSESFSDCYSQPQLNHQTVPKSTDQNDTSQQATTDNSQSGQIFSSASGMVMPSLNNLANMDNSLQSGNSFQNKNIGEVAAKQVDSQKQANSESKTSFNVQEGLSMGFQVNSQQLTSKNLNNLQKYSHPMPHLKENDIANQNSLIAQIQTKSTVPSQPSQENQMPIMENSPSITPMVSQIPVLSKANHEDTSVEIRPPPVLMPHGITQPNQPRPMATMMQPRMMTPGGMMMIPRAPMIPPPIREQAPMNFNSLSKDEPSQMMPMGIPVSQVPPQQNVQIMPPGMILSSGASQGVVLSSGVSMPMMIAGSMPSVQEKVFVPYGWKRVFLGEKIVYFSPSGIQLKSKEEIKDYLLTEGTCKCGLDCPVQIENAFDFDHKKLSDISPAVNVKNTGCKHASDTLAIAQIQNSTGFAVRHHHNPIFSKTKESVKKKTTKKKKKPFSGVLVSQMLAAREAEKQRIVEIIAQQKAEHEASLQQALLNKDEKQNKAQTNKKHNNPNSMQKNNQVQAGATSEPSINEPEVIATTTSEMQEIEKVNSPVDTAPHLAQRMVHPALLQGSRMMNLGSAAQRFGSENIVLSPKNLSRRSSLESTPTAPQESQRPFSLAEAMQAARRLNMEPTNKGETSQHSTNQQNLNEKEENDIQDDDLAVNSSDAESVHEDDMNTSRSNSIDEDTQPSQATPDEGSDNAKNIEIRRLSSTEDGNKVLEPSFHSPEKAEARKNPLQNIFNIVSGMELPEPIKDPEEERLSRVGPQVPAGFGIGMIRPQLKGRKRGQYSALPPLPHSPPPWVLGGQHPAHMQNMIQMQNVRGIRPLLPADQMQMIGQQPTQFIQPANQTIQVSGPSAPIMTSGVGQLMVAGQPQLQLIQQPAGAGPRVAAGQAQNTQQMFQLVQTVNGTMLMQMPQPMAIDTRNFVQIQPSPQPMNIQSSPSSSGSSSKSSSPGSSSNDSPTTGKKGKKRKITAAPPAAIVQQPPQQQILLSPSGNVLQTVNGASVSTSNGQFVAIGQVPQPTNNIAQQVVPQNMVINPPGQQMIIANGTLMTLPQTQGIIYQQLPDGTLLQMANQIPMLPQAGQQLVAAPPIQGQVMINGSPQIIQGNNAPQFILTPQGLMQTVGPVGANPNINKMAINVSPSDSKKKAKKSRKKKKETASSSDTSMELENNEGVVERDSVDEADTSFEDPQPSNSKAFSPRSSIQSNQVDSSGLNATPPHQKDGEFEQMRSGSELDTSFPDLDTSIDTSRHSRMSGFSTPASNLSLAEEKLSGCDSDLDLPIESPKATRVISSSREKKKKKKKKKRSHGSSHAGSSTPSVQLEDIVWGPVNGYPSWPGKVVSKDEDRSKVWVCWFVTRQVTQIEVIKLKSLSEGLEDHHKERKNSRRSKKMNLSLEKAIQEAMSELD